MKRPSRNLWKIIMKGSMAVAMVSSLSLFGAGPIAGATSSNVTGNSSVSPEFIKCEESTVVTMNLTGQAGITQNPVDVTLVLDRSGSMAGTPMTSLKSAANKFIDIIDEESDGQKDGSIGNGSRVGIVSFAESAAVNQPLSTNATNLKSAVNSLNAVGNTNHESAFQAAKSQLSASVPTNKKIIIMFTDGQTTVGGNPSDDATAAKAAGMEIYSIGLGSVNVSQLNNWATDPDAKYVFITPDPTKLDEIFKGIGAAIVTPAATNISIHSKVNSNFTISNISTNKGTSQGSGNDIEWAIPTLSSETVSLTYTITHNGSGDGDFQVNDLVTYSDAKGQQVNFQSPVVHVTGCDTQPPVTEAILTAEEDCEQDGWYNKDVSLTLNATDDKSGVDRTEYLVTFNGQTDGTWKTYGSPVTFSEEGTYEIKYKSLDKAGNIEVEKSVSFNIDKTKPTVDLKLDRTVLWAPNHKLVPIKVTIDANDLGSGIKSIQLVSITSNEDENGLGDGNTKPDYADAEFGTDDRAFKLRAERSGLGEDRVYTITYKVEDEACNETIATATVTVPHDQSK
ncbi:VWA domain-containing protein [Neobacillus sp. CF12]|uniref:vWA domain-containing protein n=1 Tax=Neobacillus sp. CF12 TaxID=3055864 RepID=UPI0025A1F7B9|nr:VWA domain-containing protein [Neobacillus sp. CF12]MDM5329878.1 VWA domain-containing protein [Neobacillus sp. CF12]